MTTTRGQHLIGKEIGSCVLEKTLGYGGSSAVFLARSLTSKELVAVKVFQPRSTMDVSMRKNFYRRFLREAEAASKLNHSHILSIYAYGEHEGLPYIVMPYMRGGTLSEYVEKHGPLSLHEALGYIEQMSAALDYAHTQGCIHCDVKPANILLDGSGQASLSDFGIVRLMQEAQTATSEHGSEAKSNEVLMGTPDYVSPEQALGESLDGRSDIYSLGATLYYLLTGEPPFKAETPIALALMHVHEAPTPVGLLRADVTPQIDFVLSKALAKWPEERFQTANAFCSAFALAVHEANELPLSSSQHSRMKTPWTNDEQLVAALPTIAPPVVLIKRLTRRSFNLWRLGLTIGLITVILLAGLFTALFLFTTKSLHSQTFKKLASQAVSHQVHDDLVGDEQDWQTSSTFFFQNGSYHIQNKSPSSVALALYLNHAPGNFQLSVDTVELAGSYNSADYYGVAFRASADQSRYYLFEMAAWNGGQYGFLCYNKGIWTRLAVGSIPSFLTGAGRHNLISIEAKTSTFTFAINGHRVGKTVHDRSNQALLSGEIGLVVEEQNTEVAFSQLHIANI